MHLPGAKKKRLEPKKERMELDGKEEERRISLCTRKVIKWQRRGRDSLEGMTSVDLSHNIVLYTASLLPELREICDASELLRECPDAMLVPVPANEFNDLLSSSIILQDKQ